MENNEINNTDLPEKSIEDIIEEFDAQEKTEEVKEEPKKKNTKKKVKKILIIVLCVLLSIIIALVSAFFVLTYIGKSQFHKADTHIVHESIEIEDETTIVYNGKKYELNKNIVSILVMGIDRSDINESLGSGNNGQADVIFVATIDTKTKKVNIIPISRETIADVNVYTTNGKYVGTERQQICLAYAYGNTPQESSENVLKSVRRLLYGINISSYVTLELEGLAKLTDIVDGVQLNSIEEFIYKKVTYKKGQSINLKDDLAIRYIQYRGDDLEANDRRMQRQKQFLTALINKTGNAVMSDFTKLGKIYSELSPYFSSNVSIAQITYLAKTCLSMNFGDSMNYKSVNGELKQGEKWVEFYVDEDQLLQTVIDTFYTPKK